MFKSYLKVEFLCSLSLSFSFSFSSSSFTSSGFACINKFFGGFLYGFLGCGFFSSSWSFVEFLSGFDGFDSFLGNFSSFLVYASTASSACFFLRLFWLLLAFLPCITSLRLSWQLFYIEEQLSLQLSWLLFLQLWQLELLHKRIS